MLLPAGWVVATDVLRRAPRLLALDPLHMLGYCASAAVTIALWSSFAIAIRRRSGPLRTLTILVFVCLFGLVAGTQSAFYSAWGAYAGLEVFGYDRAFLSSATAGLDVKRPGVLLHFVVAVVISLLVVNASRTRMRGGKWRPRLSIIFTFVMLWVCATIPASYVGVQSSTPDMIYFHGMAKWIRASRGAKNEFPYLRVQRRKVDTVPAMDRKPAIPRNVLLILQESQRFDVTCVRYTPGCTLATRRSNLAAPNRVALPQLRANASTTAISLAALWAGLPPIANRRDTERAPLIWDYANAAGYDTAYWTSQNLLALSARLFVQDSAISTLVTGTTLDPLADLGSGADDMVLADRVIHDLPRLKEPFFAVVHLSNIHAIPVVDPDDSPFQPVEAIDYGTKGGVWEPLDTWVAIGKMPHLRNYYMNAVYRSDKAVGAVLGALRESRVGQRTVVVYTSDHGEALEEHHQYGHTYGLGDEQLRVPGWIDAPPGTLTDEERDRLTMRRGEFMWHIDMFATMMDLLGLWHQEVRGSATLTPFGRSLFGRSWDRDVMVPISNCAWVWECRYPNVGVMQGQLKLWSQRNGRSYRCFDVLRDPGERNDLGEQQCDGLLRQARHWYKDPWLPDLQHMPIDRQGDSVD